MRKRRGRPVPPAPDGHARVLIISASMGAGHDGAARSLAAQLRQSGHGAEVKDFLDSGPLRVGSALRMGYEFELKHLPSAYDATYRFWYRVPWLCPVIAWLVAVLTRRRVLRWVRDAGADVVVSTYPLATLCLGRLRSTGRLDVPAVNFITDFGVHPLWVHRGIDLNLAVHDTPAQMALARTGRRSVACGPVVSPSFEPDRLPNRQAARTAIGVRQSEAAVLVVAGSWGVGDVESTWAAITASGDFTPVVVCGRDHNLFQRVTALAGAYDGNSVVIGWTDEMPQLVAACDALVENAGGLTSLEAMRGGLPVVSFHPIAGHGKENTARMADAGVSLLASDAAGLTAALRQVTSDSEARTAQVRRAWDMFRRQPADLVVSAEAVPQPAFQPVRTLVRVTTAVAAFASLAWLGLTSGVAMATEAGAGVAHPARGTGPVAYVGVRLDGYEMADPTIVSDLEQMHLTAVIDDSTAQENLLPLKALVADGVNVENGGIGDATAGGRPDQDYVPWSRARRDAEAGHNLGALIDRRVTVTVPGRRVNAWDLIECRNAHTSLVVPNHIIDAIDAERLDSIHLTPQHIYLINGLGATPAQLAQLLSQLDTSLQANHLNATPLATLT